MHKRAHNVDVIYVSPAICKITQQILIKFCIGNVQKQFSGESHLKTVVQNFKSSFTNVNYHSCLLMRHVYLNLIKF